MKRIIGSVAAVMVTIATLGLASTTHADAKPGLNNLGVGSRGSGVWCVQRILNTVAGVHLTEDSIYGNDTRDAVQLFQWNKGLPTDGIVGPVTGTALLNSKGGDDYCWEHVPTLD
ncbi:peptidoglycan-binding domain-containing protein [Nocardia gipuzkoensis]|uniref:peptidoglycan-binding domain-containing protein n=1 Tax=Nocardia gipuzkoensis TaxID=2749991 RepID=UPI0015EE7C0F|nr:peptidoglycan-binding domain-containing protein [Nocardia gipuzkoensis]